VPPFCATNSFGLGAPVPSEVRIDKENMKVYMDFEARLPAAH
jgi:hypothetical protein